MSVGMAERSAEVFAIGEATRPQTLSAIEAAGIYKGDVAELSEEAHEALTRLAEIKNIAIGYVQGSAFLREKLYPPETWPGHTEQTHTIYATAEDGALVLHRRALLRTDIGQIWLDVAGETDLDELDRLGGLFDRATENGTLNNDFTDFSKWRKDAELATMRSGIETPDERRRAVVTFGAVGDQRAFVLNGSVQKLRSGESQVDSGQLLDDEGVTDTRIFEAVLAKLQTVTGKKEVAL